MQPQPNEGQLLGRGDGRKCKPYVKPEIKSLRETHTPRIYALSLLAVKTYKGTTFCRAVLHLMHWADQTNALIAGIEDPIGEGEDRWGISGLPLPTLNLRRADAENGARTVLRWLAQCCPVNAFDALLETFEAIGIEWGPNWKPDGST